MSNLTVPEEAEHVDKDVQMDELLKYHIIENVQDTGLRVGLFGLAEKEWVDMMPLAVNVPCTYEDYIECSRRMTHFLKTDKSCDVIIALTHMRLPNDRELAEKVPGIDLILGGHDHQSISEMNKDTGIPLVKSGTDFEEFSDLTFYLGVS